MARVLSANQRANLNVLDIESGAVSTIYASSTMLFEAPNWTRDGKWLIVNGDGLLFRIAVNGGSELEQISLGEIPPINNDHVVSADGATVYVSSTDGHIYAAAVDGSVQRRITNEREAGYRHFLHGLSPDERTLVYTGMEPRPDGSPRWNIYTIPVAGGTEFAITDDEFADDGPEFSTDGASIYFNSERGSDEPGHAQLFRVRTDATGLEQLTHDERVNWFPHPSPVDETIVYVSFPSGTLGHPADVDVHLRLLDPSGGIRDLASVFGGQGTMNVPSWSPDGRGIAYVEYPVG